MTRDEMIEKVAESIYRDRNGAGCKHWNRLPNSHRHPYLQDAKSAIDTIFAALQDPTEEMMRAIGATSVQRLVWQAMLAASPLAPEGGRD